jgi:hypothetical protein
MSALLELAGLRQALQAPIPDVRDREAESDADFLRDALKRAIGIRLSEEAAGVFRDQAGAVIRTDDHPQDCRCQPCTWRREYKTVPAGAPGNTIPAAPGELAVVKAPSPPAPNLRVVPPPVPAPAPKAEPAAPVRSAGELMEQRRILSDRRDSIRRQISALADQALTDPDVRARSDRMQADLNCVKSELNQIKNAITKATPPSDATRLFFENGGNMAGRSSYDMSPDPSWPRLR